MKDRIRKLLASGLKASEVASIVGCTPAYISQLLKDETFKAAVEADLIAAQTEKTEEDHLDNRYQNTEHKILSRINEELPNAELPQLVRALEVVGRRQSERRREKLPAPPAAVNHGNIYITQLALPAHAVQPVAPVVSVNENNEIISIDNRILAPMSSDGVKNIFAQMQASQKQIAADDAKIISEI